MCGGAPHLSKHGVLIDGPILHPSLALPDDLLVLLEPPVQQEDLRGGFGGCHHDNSGQVAVFLICVP